MQLDEIEQQELTASEREVLANDRERWKRMGAGAHLDAWLAYGPGLMIRRRLAMRIAFVNKPEGRGYTEAMSALLKRDGLDTMDKTSITAVLWLHDDPNHMSMLREIRDAMNPGQRSRLNSPISARQKVEKAIKARAGHTEERVRESPVSLLKQQIGERDREIAQLRTKLASTDAGSLFDLKQDTPEDIASSIVANVSDAKAARIEQAIAKARKAKRRTPAG